MCGLRAAGAAMCATRGIPMPGCRAGRRYQGRSNKAAVQQRSEGRGWEYRGRGTGCPESNKMRQAGEGNVEGRARYAGLVSHAPQGVQGRPRRQLGGGTALAGGGEKAADNRAWHRN